MTDWSAPVLLGDGSGRSAQDGRVSMNEAGDAVLAWQVYDGTKWIINATTYAGEVWGETVTLSSGPGSCGAPAVAIDGQGNALVMYTQFDGYQYFINSVNYISGSWGAPQLVMSEIDNQPTIQIAMNANGNAVAVWNSHYGSASVIEVATYHLGSWQSAEPTVISNIANAASDPQIALNSNGDAVLAWSEEWGSTYVIISAFRYDGFWSGPQAISEGSGQCAYPDVGISSTGRMVVVWQQIYGDHWVVNATAGLNGIWDSASTLSAPGATAYDPQVAMNDAEDCGIVWTMEIGYNTMIHAMVRQGGPWVQEDLSSGMSYVGSPQLAIDQDGDMMAIWYEGDVDHSFIEARAFTSGAWGDEEMVEMANNIYAPRVAVNGNGGAMAVWYEDDDTGPYQTYASIYTPQPRVLITSPDEGSFNNTGTVTVQWTGMNVDHYTMSVNGAEPLNLGTDTSATLSALADGEYEINITGYSSSGLSCFDLISYVVDTITPAVSIAYPAIGAWYNSSTLNATWTVSDTGSGVANVSVSMDGSEWTDVATNYHEFTGLADGQHNVSVRAYDNAGNFRVSYKIFNIDTSLPVLNITDPEDEALINSTSVELVWEGLSDSPIGRYWLSVDSSEFMDVGMNTSRTITGLGEGKHTVVLKARDFAGNYNTTSVEFTVDSIAPVINITAPADGLRTTERNITVEWTITETGTQLEDTEISVDDGEWQIVNDHSYALHDLADGAHTIAVRASDNAGNVEVETIEITVDNEAPTATISPSGDGVSINTAITVSFSEAMNQTSVVITVEGFESVAGTVSWDGNVATFTPTSPLPYNRGYAVNVTGQDLAGNEMAEAFSTFTTLKDEGTISGTIRDADGNAVVNATVTLSNGMSTTTDAFGHFELTGIPSGSYGLNVTKDGFKTISETVSVVAGQTTALETMSLVSSASSTDGGNGWMLGIVGVAVVAMLAIGFIVYRYKKR